jgi:S1-C subfamily serine protease
MVIGHLAARLAAGLTVVAVPLIGGCGGHVPPAPADAAAPVAAPAAAAVVALRATVAGDRVDGAGAMIDASRGLILTTTHTLWGASSMKVSTSLGVVFGRIVARDTCGDLALVQTQPWLPGLVALRGSATRLGAGQRVTFGRRVVQRLGGPGSIIRTRATLVPADARSRATLPRSPGSLALGGRYRPRMSGAPVISADGRLVGMTRVVAPGGDRSAAVVIPWAEIALRLRELRPGRQTAYVGWRERNRCAGRLNRLARRLHPDFRTGDARLQAPIAATRLPGTEELDR